MCQESLTKSYDLWSRDAALVTSIEGGREHKYLDLALLPSPSLLLRALPIGRTQPKRKPEGKRFYDSVQTG